MREVLPKSIGLDVTLDLVEKIRKQVSLTGIELDFGQVEYADPFTLVFLSNEISRLGGIGEKIQIVGIGEKDFLAMMGFYSFLGMKIGTDWGGEAQANYIPQQKLDVDELKRECVVSRIHPAEMLEIKFDKTATTLARQERGVAHKTIKFCLREMSRNVAEHSTAGALYYSAVSQKDQGLVHFTILDHGVGLRGALSKNPHLAPKLVDDHSALNWAILPSISGIAFRGSKIPDKKWSNSGYGLYMAWKICCEGRGNFFIASGNCGMIMSKNVGKKTYFKTDFPGTVVRLVIDAKKIDSIAESVPRFLKEGEEIAESYKDITLVSPSAASRTIAENIKNPGT